MKDKLPQLFQFFAGTFNQDWHCDGENAEELVHLFLKDNPNSWVREVVYALKLLLEMKFSDQQLEELVANDLGCSYDPALDGMLYTEWVSWIKDTLKKGLEEVSNLGAP